MRPTTEQAAIQISPYGRRAVPGGAGTGKTDSIARSLVQAFYYGWPLETHLVLTMTRRARKVMTDRLERILGFSLPNGVVRTYHSFATWLLRRFVASHGYIIGRKPGFTFANMKAMVGEIMCDLDMRRKMPPAGVIAAAIEFAGNTGTSVGHVLKTRYRHLRHFKPRIVRIADEYETRKEQRNLVDFSDVLRMACLLLETCPEARRSAAPHVQFLWGDEHQDASFYQKELFNRLAAAKPNATAAADMGQGVLTFAGGDYLSLEGRVRRQGAR